MNFKTLILLSLILLGGIWDAIAFWMSSPKINILKNNFWRPGGGTILP